MSIAEMACQGAMFGSALFFNKASSTGNYEDLSGDQEVPQLAVYTATGAVCGALVGLGLNLGQKICPRGMSIAMTAARSFSTASFAVAKGKGSIYC
jgi:hypothetical protein